MLYGCLLCVAAHLDISVQTCGVEFNDLVPADRHGPRASVSDSRGTDCTRTHPQGIQLCLALSLPPHWSVGPVGAGLKVCLQLEADDELRLQIESVTTYNSAQRSSITDM